MLWILLTSHDDVILIKIFIEIFPFTKLVVVVVCLFEEKSKLLRLGWVYYSFNDKSTNVIFASDIFTHSDTYIDAYSEGKSSKH